MMSESDLSPVPVPLARLRAYFAQLESVFQQACGRCAPRSWSLGLAGHGLNLKLAGDWLEPIFTQALAHLAIEEGRAARSLDLWIWSEVETGVALPPPPWQWPDNAGGPVALPAGCEAFRVMRTAQTNIFIMFNEAARRVVIWVADPRALPNNQWAAPLLQVFQWWSTGVGLRILHAGCVGTAAGAVLMVGKGGSGKSTTSLLCALSGLDYLGDDYCLVDPKVSRVYCLYNSGKLHRDHWPRLPELAARMKDPRPDPLEKPMIFMQSLPSIRVALSRPIRAILAPLVTGGTETCLSGLSQAEALRALAPSTLFQLSRGEADVKALRDMSALVRSRPCFRLELGSRLEAIPPVVRGLLQSLDKTPLTPA